MRLKRIIKSKKLNSYSSFCQKVWLACLEIPEGEVRTYQWIAKKIGKPKAARAIGQALAANPFAPTIPCHRVVRSDGSLGGYSGPGGLKQKLQLLRREGIKATDSLLFPSCSPRDRKKEFRLLFHCGVERRRHC